jgi:hypothetical protein
MQREAPKSENRNPKSETIPKSKSSKSKAKTQYDTISLIWLLGAVSGGEVSPPPPLLPPCRHQ